MNTHTLTPSCLQNAVDTLRSGGLIAYPTEAVWGLGCDPQNAAAFDRLLACKRRPIEKGVILVASQLSQLEPLLAGLTKEQIAQLAAEPEQPTTWLIPANDSVPLWIRGDHATVAVRLSRHPVVVALCDAFDGLIVSTSANHAGEMPARNEQTAREVFGDAIDAYISGEVGGQTQPSRIIDLLSGQQLR